MLMGVLVGLLEYYWPAGHILWKNCTFTVMFFVKSRLIRKGDEGLKSIMLGLLAFSIFFMAGCTNGDQGYKAKSANYLNHGAFIEFNGNEYELTRGSYKWETKLKSGETRSEMTDHAGPFQMASYIEPIKVEPNQRVKILLEGDPQIEVFEWNESGREKKYEVTQNQFIIPADKGEYIFEVFSKWKNGEISYAFVADVQ